MRLCQNSIRKWNIGFSKCAWHPPGVKSPRQPCNTGKLKADQASRPCFYLFFHRRSALVLPLQAKYFGRPGDACIASIVLGTRPADDGLRRREIKSHRYGGFLFIVQWIRPIKVLVG